MATEIEVHQLPELSQHSCKPVCLIISEIIIAAEIKGRPRWALHQHSFKHPCILSFSLHSPVSCLGTKCSFSAAVPLQASSQQLLMKRTTRSSPALSSGGMAPRAAAKPSADRNTGCVCVACPMVCVVLFFCAAVNLPLCCASALRLSASAFEQRRV
jgi:hypothetical protein